MYNVEDCSFFFHITTAENMLESTIVELQQFIHIASLIRTSQQAVAPFISLEQLI